MVAVLPELGKGGVSPLFEIHLHSAHYRLEVISPKAEAQDRIPERKRHRVFAPPGTRKLDLAPPARKQRRAPPGCVGAVVAKTAEGVKGGKCPAPRQIEKPECAVETAAASPRHRFAVPVSFG